MAGLIRDLGPQPGDSEWRAAQAALAASDTFIGHIDTGLFPHPALGFAADGTPPANIRLDLGRNVFDPKAEDARPVTDLSIPDDPLAEAAEYPDHGVKTLSVILADLPGVLVGVAPGAKILPYRVANGPVFVGRARSGRIGAAMDHAMRLPSPPKAFSISMGNPGFTGFTEFLRLGLGGSPGMSTRTADAINRAYEAGIVVVAAGGQIVNNVSYPARFARVVAVGGITGDEVHYPIGGYDNADLIDVWARASAINRASGLRLPDGTIRPIHAEDPESGDLEPSGTSYAAPQVAAAAALWLTRWADELAKLPEPWMVVESFRLAIRGAARKETIRLFIGWDDRIAIRRLDVEALLRTPPDLRAKLRKRDAASRLASLL